MAWVPPRNTTQRWDRVCLTPSPLLHQSTDPGDVTGREMNTHGMKIKGLDIHQSDLGILGEIQEQVCL